MAMSRKDYIAIAKVIAEVQADSPDTEARLALSYVAGGLADLFAEDNPRFDRPRFFAAALYSNRESTPVKEAEVDGHTFTVAEDQPAWLRRGGR